jgi:predicted RNase H-like nuclease (RuvC/YqgF family)
MNDQQDDKKAIKPKNFFENALSSIKGRDLHEQVDRYTQEVTVVLEGMNTDLESLISKQEISSAEITVLQNTVEEQGKKIKEQGREIEALKSQLSKSKKSRKANISDIIKQLTILAAIVCATWLITSLLNMFGG